MILITIESRLLPFVLISLFDYSWCTCDVSWAAAQRMSTVNSHFEEQRGNAVRLEYSYFEVFHMERGYVLIGVLQHVHVQLLDFSNKTAKIWDWPCLGLGHPLSFFFFKLAVLRQLILWSTSSLYFFEKNRKPHEQVKLDQASKSNWIESWL